MSVADPFSLAYWRSAVVCLAMMRMLMAATAAEPRSHEDSSKEPYSSSPVIEGLRWAAVDSILRRAQGSDNWPMTWGDDGNQYTAYGDGYGFEPKLGHKLSLGLARVEGEPDSFRGVNIRSASIERTGDGRAGPKASGILMVKGVLYLAVRNLENSQLAWSDDRGQTWTWAQWKFTESFGCPTFVNFGRDYAGARDHYVYLVSQDAATAYEAADGMVMARVPKDRIRERNAYEFYAGTLATGQIQWTRTIGERKAVFEHAGRCYRGGITYHPYLKRYLWVQILPESQDARGPRFQGGLGIYDAPEPWGPWTTVYFTDQWDVGPGETASFPVKWMEADGRTLHLVFSGDDHFSVRRATLDLW